MLFALFPVPSGCPKPISSTRLKSKDIISILKQMKAFRKCLTLFGNIAKMFTNIIARAAHMLICVIEFYVQNVVLHDQAPTVIKSFMLNSAA